MLIKNPRMTYKDKKPITSKKFENNFWMLWAFSLGSLSNDVGEEKS